MVLQNYKHRLIPGSRRGEFLLPDCGTMVYLNPMESALYHLFLNHPEGITSDALPQHKDELNRLYVHESIYDDKQLMERTVAALCTNANKTFYINVSRIKKKFAAVLGARQSRPYIIKRDKSGRYRTRATFNG